MFLLSALTLVCCSCSTDRVESVVRQEQEAIIASSKTAYEEAYDAYRQALASVESAGERRGLKHPTVEDYSADMMATIERDVESAAAFDGLNWLYDKTKRKDRQTANKYRELLIKHHCTSEGIGSVAGWISYDDNSGQTEQDLLKILEHSKDEVDLAKTVLGLIKHYLKVKKLQTDTAMRGYAAGRLGEEGMKYVDSRSLEELNLLIDRYFAIGMEKYGEVWVWRGPFADMLKPYHFEHTRLQVGMPAPDIVGKDIDGVEFKLSDYRGTVVMLDFWGDW